MNENIFTNLYNKVLGFFRQTDKEENAKDIACNRLRVVLMQDRTNLTPELMERMRKELIELLSKYVEMDKEALELNLEQDGDQMALMLSIPVLRAKEESEITAEDEASDEKTEETEEDSDNTDAEESSDETADDEEKLSVEDDSDDDSDDEDEFENDACDCGKCEKCNPKNKKK